MTGPVAGVGEKASPPLSPRAGLLLIPRRAARRFPSAEAVWAGDRWWSHAELYYRSLQAGRLLVQTGVQRGDRVALLHPNSAGFTAAFFGVMAAGATAAPLNPQLTPREIAGAMQSCEIGTIFASEELAERASEAAAAVRGWRPTVLPLRPGEDARRQPVPPGHPMAEPAPAVILFTSGDSGSPRGVALSHRALLLNAWWCAAWSQSTDPGQPRRLTAPFRALGAVPQSHAFGLTCIQHASLMHGGSFVPMERWDPEEAIRLMLQHRINSFSGVPAMYAGLIEAPLPRRPTLAWATTGGAHTPDAWKQGFTERFGPPVQDGYGLTEAAPLVCFQSASVPRKEGAVGPAIGPASVRIVDLNGQELPAGEEGEIVVGGDCLMDGYWGEPPLNGIGGEKELRTGDLGRLDHDGHLYLAGRLGDVINRGGYQVHPAELEALFAAHPGVAAACCVALPHPRLGQEPAMALQPRKDYDLQPDMLQAWAAARLAPYKRPRSLYIVAAIPVGRTGKPLRGEVLRLLERMDGLSGR